MITKEFKFENGDKVSEKVTGFVGVITGTCFYLTGCSQYLVTPKCKADGTHIDGCWYDEGRLTLIKNEIKEKEVQTKANGCDIPAPIK